MRRLSAPRRVRCARAKRAQRTRPEQASGTIRRMDLARNTKYVIRPMQMRTESAQRRRRASAEHGLRSRLRLKHELNINRRLRTRQVNLLRLRGAFRIDIVNRPTVLLDAQRMPAIWAALDQRARFGRGHRMYPVTQCADWQREAERVLHQVLHMWRGLQRMPRHFERCAGRL